MDSLRKQIERTCITSSAVMLVTAVCIGLFGCAGYRPVVAGDNFFGVGAFRDRSRTIQEDVSLIDVDGFGFLAIGDRVVFGYADYSLVIASDPDRADFHVFMDDAELAVGPSAEFWAEVFSREMMSMRPTESEGNGR